MKHANERWIAKKEYEEMIDHRSYVYNMSSCEYTTNLSAKTCLDLMVAKILFYVCKGEKCNVTKF